MRSWPWVWGCSNVLPLRKSGLSSLLSFEGHWNVATGGNKEKRKKKKNSLCGVCVTSEFPKAHFIG